MERVYAKRIKIENGRIWLMAEKQELLSNRNNSMS
jgi:hypothetical protein